MKTQLSHARTQSRKFGRDTLMAKLMRQSVETGAITAFVAAVELILFLVFRDYGLHLAPYVCLQLNINRFSYVQ